MYQQDWILRQIEMIMHVILHQSEDQSDIIAEVIEHEIDKVTGKSKIIERSELFYEIITLLNIGDINTAENLLHEEVRKDSSKAYLPLAVEFYAQLSKMEVDYLEAHNFSHEEIGQGLKDILKIYDISI